MEERDKQLLKMIRKHLEEEKYSEAEVAGNKVLILSMNNIDGKKDHKVYFYALVLYHENKQDIHSNQREGKEHATIKLQINR